MSKFLELVEENRPGEDKYTVELKDVNGELVDSFLMFGVGSPFENFDRFKEQFGSPIPVEDQEIKSGAAGYDVDKEIAKLANKAQSGVGGLVGKAMGTKAQRAKKLMKDRENAVVKAFGIFDQDTKDLKQSLKDKAKEQ